jgi:hypothetical protein
MENSNPQNGWTTRVEGTALRRSDRAPDHFTQESVKANPAAAAWGEPGYVDPDLSHGSLELGTRYWQGFAKNATPRNPEERAMSPEWVATKTDAENTRQKFRREGDGRDVPDELDPNRLRVVRETETQRNSSYPG